MKELGRFLLTIATASLVAGCGSHDECVAEQAEITALKAIVALHQAQFESRSAQAAGPRASEEILAALRQRDENMRLAQQAEIQRLEEKLLALSEAQQQAQDGDAAAAAARQAELQAALQEAEVLRANLEVYERNQSTVETRLGDLGEVTRQDLEDPAVFPPPTNSDGEPVQNSPEQDMIGMMMVAGVCYAASGGLCAIVAADFLQSFLGGSTTEEDIQRMGSIMDKTSRGEELSDSDKEWIRKRTADLFEDNENVQGILVDVLGGSETLDEGFRVAMTDAVNEKIGADNMRQLQRLIEGDIACADLNELLNGVDAGSKRNLRKVLPILQKKLATNNPNAARCLGEIRFYR